jgi:hypothetical protein
MQVGNNRLVLGEVRLTRNEAVHLDTGVPHARKQANEVIHPLSGRNRTRHTDRDCVRRKAPPAAKLIAFPELKTEFRKIQSI